MRGTAWHQEDKTLAEAERRKVGIGPIEVGQRYLGNAGHCQLLALPLDRVLVVAIGIDVWMAAAARDARDDRGSDARVQFSCGEIIEKE